MSHGGPTSLTSPFDPSIIPRDGNWWGEFHAEAPKKLDVDLKHTLIHESVVCCVRFSADGRYLATGCHRLAIIWSSDTGENTSTFDHEADIYVRAVVFSPNGQYLATAGEDKLVRIWNITTSSAERVFTGHAQEIYSLHFSATGRFVVSGSGDSTARIWDLETQTCKVLTIQEPGEIDTGITSVAFSPDTRLVAAGSLDMTVRVWDIETGNLVERIRGHADSVYDIAFSPDGQGIVSASLDRTLKCWDIGPFLRSEYRDAALVQGQGGGGEGGEKGSVCTLNLRGHRDYVLSSAISPDGAWVVSGSKDRSIQFWNPASGGLAQVIIQSHKNSVLSVEISPAGKLFASGGGDWRAKIWSYSP